MGCNVVFKTQNKVEVSGFFCWSCVYNICMFFLKTLSDYLIELLFRFYMLLLRKTWCMEKIKKLATTWLIDGRDRTRTHWCIHSFIFSLRQQIFPECILSCWHDVDSTSDQNKHSSCCNGVHDHGDHGWAAIDPMVTWERELGNI